MIPSILKLNIEKIKVTYAMSFDRMWRLEKTHEET